MTLRYYARHERLFAEYVGQRKGIENAEPLCQRIPGADIDRVVGDILPELVNPVNLEIALTLQAGATVAPQSIRSPASPACRARSL